MGRRSDLVYQLVQFFGEQQVNDQLNYQLRPDAQTWRLLRGAQTPAEQVAQTLGQIETALHALDGKLPASRLIQGYAALNDLRHFLGLPPTEA